MIADELKYRIFEAFSFPPTTEQAVAISVFTDFLTCRDPRAVMILRGSAGTGKTTLAAAIVKALTVLRQKLVLMAPTGRAAKVFSLYAGQPAYTIHRRIYRQRSAGDMSTFNLNVNLSNDTLFIVDEASMISNQGFGESTFGSGCLLDDLITFVYSNDGQSVVRRAGGENCRLLLIGDRAQLPPVGEETSPALSAEVLRGYGLQVFETDLNEVLRQSQQSGILWNATMIRGEGLLSGEESIRGEGQEVRGERIALPRIRLQGFSDIHVVPGDELIESLATSYSRAGMDDTLVITRSNKRANIYNQGIRNTVLDREELLCRGDRLMIVKNNYYWITTQHPTTLQPTPNPSRREGGLDTSTRDNSAQNQQQSNQTPLPLGGVGGGLLGGFLTGSFLANGDMATVQRVRNVHEQYGFHFAEVTLQFPDYDDMELTCMVLLDTLTAEAPSLTRDQQQQLYEGVMADYADIPLKSDRLRKLKEDRYYNALQVKFAYAVTCHKAQGGQWAHVYIDQGYMTDDMAGGDYLHWLYTAFTRATEQLFLVNWPSSMLTGHTNSQ